MGSQKIVRAWAGAPAVGGARHSPPFNSREHSCFIGVKRHPYNILQQSSRKLLHLRIVLTPNLGKTTSGLSTLLTAFGTTPRDMCLTISRLVRSNSLSGREAAGLDELQHLTLSELEEGAASAEQSAAALPSLSIWERRHRVSKNFTRAPHQPGSKAAERAVKARLWNLMGVLCLVGLIGTTTTGTVRIVLSGNRTRRSGALCRAPRCRALHECARPLQ